MSSNALFSHCNMCNASVHLRLKFCLTFRLAKRSKVSFFFSKTIWALFHFYMWMNYLSMLCMLYVCLLRFCVVRVSFWCVTFCVSFRCFILGINCGYSTMRSSRHLNCSFDTHIIEAVSMGGKYRVSQKNGISDFKL